MDGLFLLDLVLTFFTGYREGVKLILNRSKIARRYLKGWFTIDLISSLPFQTIEIVYTSSTGSTEINKMLRLLRLPRIYRLVRLFKCVRLMKLPAMKKCCKYFRINDGVKRLLVVLGLTLFFSHLVTCLWVLFAKLDDYSADTWVARTDSLNRAPAYQYFLGFYWTAQTVTTVGFGDVPA